MAREAHPERFKADVVLLAACVGWGSTFAIVKGALADASPGAFNALRFAIGTLAAALFARGALRDRASLRAGVVLGVFLWLGFALNTWGLRYTTATRSGFLTGLCVVLVPPLGRFLFKTRVPGWAWAGAGTAGVGLAVLAAPSLLAGGSLLGDAVTLAAAFAYALQMLLTERYAPRIVPSATLTVELAVVALLSAALVPFEGARVHLTASLVAALAFTGLCASALFLSMQLWAQARTSAVRAALILSLEPLFGALFGRALLGEALLPEIWAGGALILCGILLTEIGPRLAPRRAVAADPASPES